MRRVFIGGCSRSGTTLLQELLANHPRVLTFPETGVFLKALGMRGRVLPWVHLGITLGKERKALARLREQMVLAPEGCPPLPPRRFLLKRSIKDVVAFLDALTDAQGKNLWVEKTPRHVLHAKRIGNLVPDSTFIHMIRDGRDVVASIVDRARRFPEDFPRQEDPAYGIRQWNQSMAATGRALGEGGHVVVLYEGLSAHPVETLQTLCPILGLEFREDMLERRKDRSFVTETEGWKEQIPGPIRPAPPKFPHLFDEGTQLEIQEALEMNLFQAIRDHIQGEPGSVWTGR